MYYGKSEGKSDGMELVCYWNMQSGQKWKSFLNLKLHLWESLTTFFGKDRRLCKIEANAIIYSN